MPCPFVRTKRDLADQVAQVLLSAPSLEGSCSQEGKLRSKTEGEKPVEASCSEVGFSVCENVRKFVIG